MGLVNWLARFLPGISEWTQPLYSLLHKNKQWKWDNVHENAFNYLRKKIEGIQRLKLPDLSQKFYIECDASYYSVGAVLLQRDDKGKLTPVEWCSKTFDKTQINWDIGEKECYAVIHSIEKWRPYLFNHFVVYTDHSNLSTLFNYARTFRGNKLWRWALRLQEFNFTVTTRPGTEQVVSDYLSRYNFKDKKVLQGSIPPPKIIVYTDPQDEINALCFDPTTLQNYEIQCMTQTALYNAPTVPAYQYQVCYDSLHKEKHTPTFYEASIATYIARNNQNNIVIPPQNHTLTQDRIYSILNQNSIQDNHLFSLNSYQIHVPTSYVKSTIFVLNTNEQKSNEDEDSKLEELPSYEDDISDITEYEYVDDDELIQWVKHPFNSDEFLPPFDELKEAQQQDPVCEALFRYIKSNRSNVEAYNSLPKYIKQHVKQTQKYKIVDNILYYEKGLYCPASMRLPLVKYIHGQVKLHAKIDQTLQTLRKKFWWPYMKSDIQIIIGSCEVCRRNNTIDPKIRNALQLFPASRVFEVVHIDLVGPFPESPKGYKYLLTICDRLSRYIQIVPLKNMLAEEVTKAFFSSWVCTFGIPEAILSDQGTQFEGKIFTNLMNLLKIHKKRTTAYRPQANGLIERQHREIKKHLRAIAAEYSLNFAVTADNVEIDDWDQFLPIIAFKLNTTVSSVTKYAPIQFVLGYIPRLPQDVAWNVESSQPKLVKNDSYLSWLNNVKQIVTDKAFINQQRYDQRKKRYFDRIYNKGYQQPFIVGDIVRYKIYTSTKLSPQWSQPHKIISFKDNNPNVVNIVNVNNQDESRTINTDHLIRAFGSLPTLVPLSPNENNQRNDIQILS